MTDNPTDNEAEKLQTLAILDQNGGNIYTTFLQTGVSYWTLAAWSREKDVSLNKRLIKLAYELLATMPGKLENADLQQITRALSVVLDNIHDEDEEGIGRGDVYEKLAYLMDQYAAAKRSANDSGTVHGG